MGKIREKRRKEKQKRLLTTLVVGFSVTILVLTVTLVGISKIEQTLEADSRLPKQEWSESAQIAIDVAEPETIQIVMVGDMLMHEKIIDSGLKEDGSYNYDHLFVNVKDYIQSADLAIVNQETIMGGESFGYSGYPNFNSPYELLDAEIEAGFDLLLCATNHALDKGKTAVLNEMEYLEENCPELDYVGINQSQEDQDNDIYVYEQNGIKVAILNYTYGTNGIQMPSDAPYLVNLLDEDKVIADIQKAEEIADFTIVCPHWGTEYNLGTDSSQAKWTKIFVDNGVDLVLGTHPHVIEPIEWITSENGNEMLVYYSLGNYVNGTSSTGSGITNRMIGGIADVTIGRNEDGEVEVISYSAIPIVCHVGTGTEYSVYYLSDYTEEMAKENLILNQDQEFSKALCQSIVDSVWTEE